MNSSGKALAVFLVIVAILLISLTAMSIFIFQKEIEKRKDVEKDLEAIKIVELNLQDELKEVRKQSFIFKEKNKEADERINSLLDELELETGLREEMINKNNKLKLDLTNLTKERRDEVEEFESELKEANERNAILEEKFKKEIQLKENLMLLIEKEEQKNKELQEKLDSLEKIQSKSTKSKDSESSLLSSDLEMVPGEKKETVELEKIVIVPKLLTEGRVLSVDKETEFIILNLGQKDGLTKGRIVSVYRDKDYLGDAKITRIHPEMSAADLIPPFSIQIVQKNDKAVLKK